MSDYAKYNPDQLTRQIVQGDPDAFRQLFDDLVRSLVYFGIKITDNKSEAEDAASDAFQKLWVNRKKMTGYPQIRSYLYTIVQNRCLNYIKRQKLTDIVHKQLDHPIDTSGEINFDDRIIQTETMVIIYRAIETLTENHRDVLHKSYIEGRTTSELARALGKTEAYIRTTRARALSALRKVLEDQGFLQMAIIMFWLYRKK